MNKIINFLLLIIISLFSFYFGIYYKKQTTDDFAYQIVVENNQTAPRFIAKDFEFTMPNGLTMEQCQNICTFNKNKSFDSENEYYMILTEHPKDSTEKELVKTLVPQDFNGPEGTSELAINGKAIEKTKYTVDNLEDVFNPERHGQGIRTSDGYSYMVETNHYYLQFTITGIKGEISQFEDDILGTLEIL